MRRRDRDYWTWQQVNSDKGDADVILGGFWKMFKFCVAITFVFGAISGGGLLGVFFAVCLLAGGFVGWLESRAD